VLTLAAVLRIQLAIACVIPFIYMLLPFDSRARWQAVIAGSAVVLAAGLVDALTWSYPFQSFVENIRMNIVVGRSKMYGTAPWYSYLAVYARIWGIWGIVVLSLAAIGARRLPLLAICSLAVLATHMAIGHKEYRFAYPAMACIIALAGLGAAHLVKEVETRWAPRLASLATAGFMVVWLATSLQCASTFHEEKTRLATSLEPPQWHWVLHRGAMTATKRLGDDPSVCGIGLISISVYSTGGYSYVHRRDIHFFELLKKEHLSAVARYVNVFVVTFELAKTERFLTFERQYCDTEICVYRRPGACEAAPRYHINEVLKARGH
jgi:GPI mannosyltransferase 3